MGMFDSVWFNCPSCGERRSIEAQSKAGDCSLHDYETNNVPPKIALDIDGSAVTCSKCNASFTVGAQVCVMLMLR